MNWFLGQIGFKARQLDGGYKAYRTEVRKALLTQPAAFDLHVVCGRTGSGKTRLLHALAAEGAQVLDLEALARHRGSVLGGLPDVLQPSQKAFDSLLWQRLRTLDPARPVWVESESRKIGQLRVPESLHAHMRQTSHCYWLDMPDTARVELLLDEYAHFAADVAGFCAQLEALVALRGRDTVERWKAQAQAGEWADLFAELMRDHYDPGYERSLRSNYPEIDRARRLVLADGAWGSLRALANELVNSGKPKA